MDSVVDHIREYGFAGPIPLLPPAECEARLAALRDAMTWPPLDWLKGWAAVSRPYYELACHPELLRVARDVLGDDVMIWGAYLRTQPPGQSHAWHTDAESSSPSGRCLTAWIGLEHTSPLSTIQLISRSHRLGRTVQETRLARGVRRSEAGAEDVLSWARETEPHADWVRPAAGNGDAVLFDGRLWHGSHNTGEGTRVALIVNFAASETKIRMFDMGSLEWPFRFHEHPRPACVAVCGETGSANRFVPPPEEPARRPTNRVDHLGVPLSLGARPEVVWRPYPIFAGGTADMPSLTCHTSVLRPGHSPHPPHAHEEEEVLVMLRGEADLLVPEAEAPRRRLTPGALAYYPAGFPHTLEAVGDDPANYLMIKWAASEERGSDALGFGVHDFGARFRSMSPETGFHPRLLFEGDTRWLAKLHAHTSTLSPGAGYEPHADGYDVAILMVEGEVETLGQRVGPFGLAFHPAGAPHGIRNVGESPAKYLVFEFHG